MQRQRPLIESHEALTDVLGGVLDYFRGQQRTPQWYATNILNEVIGDMKSICGDACAMQCVTTTSQKDPLHNVATGFGFVCLSDACPTQGDMMSRISFANGEVLELVEELAPMALELQQVERRAAELRLLVSEMAGIAYDAESRDRSIVKPAE